MGRQSIPIREVDLVVGEVPPLAGEVGDLEELLQVLGMVVVRQRQLVDLIEPQHGALQEVSPHVIFS